jgi:para-aminobenzoate synthetase component 1
MALPLIEELPSETLPRDVLLRLGGRGHCVFFDSARRDPRLGRYSMIAVDPYAFLSRDLDQPVEESLRGFLQTSRARSEAPCGTQNNDLGRDFGIASMRSHSPLSTSTACEGTDALTQLAEALQCCTTELVEELPPFQGGAAGLFGYELGRQWEPIPAAAHDEFQLPVMAVGLYDVVVAFDHQQERSWIISQGFPETEPRRRMARARQRLDQMRGWLDEPVPEVSQYRLRVEEAPLGIAALAPQFEVPQLAGLTSTFDREGYLKLVQRAIDYIYAGDIFQVNLAQRLLFPAREHALALYLRLRERNPAPFAGYFDLGRFQIASASPERFVRLLDGQVETRPIKGTRRRTARPEADLFAGSELRASSKDRAENVMIVDLLRNDLSRVCTDESVRVAELCRLEVYEFVQHLVSVVQGQLVPDHDAFDLLRAVFPGGSITGAPKIRAMQIIAQMEPTARGAYCGSLGYIGFDGSMDTSILIRTVTAGRGWWQAPVGGGIVAQSDPRQEYEETWHKAEGMIRAFEA